MDTAEPQIPLYNNDGKSNKETSFCGQEREVGLKASRTSEKGARKWFEQIENISEDDLL